MASPLRQSLSRNTDAIFRRRINDSMTTDSLVRSLSSISYTSRNNSRTHNESLVLPVSTPGAFSRKPTCQSVSFRKPFSFNRSLVSSTAPALGRAPVALDKEIRRSKSTKSALVDAIERRIKYSGPLTVAAYMTEILTHPSSGYYMGKDVLGPEGDFITSPEISQMFGELVGLWFVSEWINAGAPGSVQFVELGPGRGTLADDVCRVFAQIPDMTSDVNVALVELSQRQRMMQRKKLETGNHSLADEEELSNIPDGVSSSTRHGFSVSWYDDINSVPPSPFSFIIAHEFFDALPVHKFQKTEENKWREICIDMDYSDDGPHHLRFALNPAPSPTASYLNDALSSAEDSRTHVEVSPASGALIQSVAQLVVKGGVALIADYGHEASKTDTLRGFKGHKVWDPLEDPGSADITADVDFAFLRRMAEKTDDSIITCGPVTQRQFLKEMSIDVRLSMLLQRADREQQKNLISGYRMLTDPDQMGEKFKFMAIRQSSANGTPVGFLNLPVDCA